MTDPIEELAREIYNAQFTATPLGPDAFARSTNIHVNRARHVAKALHALGYRRVPDDCVAAPARMSDAMWEHIKKYLFPGESRANFEAAYEEAIAFKGPSDAASQPRVNCGNCHKCLEHKCDDATGFPITAIRMIVCPSCGNKRCPHASDHALTCTRSNEPGQPGSIFGDWRATTTPGEAP